MPVPKLADMAKNQLARNIDRLDDVGDIPYHIVRSLLKKIENPDQLKTIEAKCPQIAANDAELWRTYIKRDILHWEKKLVEPEDPTTWWQVYEKLKEESQVEYLKQEEELRTALRKKAEEKAKNTTTISTVPIDPKKLHSKAQPRPVRVAQDRSVLSFSSGSRTKTTTSKGVMDRVKRETQEAKFKRDSAALATPTHLLLNRASTIRKAPTGMVADHAKPAPLPASTKTAPVPKTSSPSKESAKPQQTVKVLEPVKILKGPTVVLPTTEKATSGQSITGDKITGDKVTGPEKAPTPFPQPPVIYRIPKLKPTTSPERYLAAKRKRVVNVLLPNKRIKS